MYYMHFFLVCKMCDVVPTKLRHSLDEWMFFFNSKESAAEVHSQRANNTLNETARAVIGSVASKVVHFDVDDCPSEQATTKNLGIEFPHPRRPIITCSVFAV